MKKMRGSPSTGNLRMAARKKVTAKKAPARGKGSRSLVGLARAEAESLMSDARRMGAGVQKRAERVVQSFEKRAEKLLRTLETRAAKMMEPVLGKSFASRRDLQDLRGRIADLEKQVKELARRSAVAAA